MSRTKRFRPTFSAGLAVLLVLTAGTVATGTSEETNENSTTTQTAPDQVAVSVQDGKYERSYLDGITVHSPAALETTVSPEELLSPPQVPSEVVSGNFLVSGDMVMHRSAVAALMPAVVPVGYAALHIVPVYNAASPLSQAGLADIYDAAWMAAEYWDDYSSGAVQFEVLDPEPAVDAGSINLCDFNSLMDAAGIPASSPVDDEYWMAYTDKDCSGTSGLGLVNGNASAIFRIYGGVDNAAQIVTHELGHNFGLHHSGGFGSTLTLEDVALDCPTGSWQVWDTTDDCIDDLFWSGLDEYGDPVSVMGNWSTGMPAVGQLDRVGLLPSGAAVVLKDQVSTSNVTLRVSSGTSGNIAVKIPYTRGNAFGAMRGTFWVEYRKADQEPPYDSSYTAATGVQVRYIPEQNGYFPRSWVIPVSSGPQRYTLATGNTWTDPNEAFSVKTVSTNASAGTVTVQIKILKSPNYVDITQHPENTAFTPGESVTLWSSANGYPTQPVPQWQTRLPDGEWVDLEATDATSPIMSVKTAYMDGSNGRLYQVVYSNGLVTETSNKASIYDGNTGKPVLLADLPDLEVQSGALFVVASGILSDGSATSYVRNSLGSWPPLPVTNGNSIHGMYATADSYYNVVAHNNAGTAIMANGQLTVVNQPTCTFYTSPTMASANPGDNVTFTVGAMSSACSGMSVSWEMKTVGGQWQSLGHTGQSYVHSVAAGDGYAQIRPMVSGGGKEYRSNVGVVVMQGQCEFTTQPLTANANVGDSVEFLVDWTPGCSGLTLQWQKAVVGGDWEDIPNASGASYTRTASSDDVGLHVRAVFKYGSVVKTASAAAALNIDTCQRFAPVSVSTVAGAEVTFEAASGTGCVLQWQRSTNRGGTWGTITGATQSTYVHTVMPGEHGVKYRARYIKPDGTYDYSTPATVTVTACTPGTATNIANALGSTFHAYVWNYDHQAQACANYAIQWQRSTDHGETWSNIQGSTEAHFWVSGLTAADDLARYRPVLTYGGVVLVGAAYVSRVVIPNAPCQFVRQPESKVLEPAETYALIEYNTQGCNGWTQHLQMQRSGESWIDITNPRLIETAYFDWNWGFTTNWASVFNIQDGVAFRAVLINGSNAIYSNGAAVTYREGCLFTQGPVPTAKAVGELATFRVVTAESCSPNTTLSWQKSVDGGQTWNSILYAHSNTYSEYVQAFDSANLYRAILEDGILEVPSRAVLLIVSSDMTPQETIRPEFYTYMPYGETMTLSVAAMGQADPMIQWQQSENHGTTWEDIPGATSETYTPSPRTEEIAVRYRAVFTNQSGATAGSEALIYWYLVIEIASHPLDSTVAAGGTAAFSVSFVDGTTGGRWERSDNGGITWYELPVSVGHINNDYTPGATKTLLIPVTLADDGAMFRARIDEQVTWRKVYSQPATLTVT